MSASEPFLTLTHFLTSSWESLAISDKIIYDVKLLMFVVLFVFLPHEQLCSCSIIGSCRNSVCPSVSCVLCDKTKKCTVDILAPHKRAITAFLTPTAVGGRRSLLFEICAQNDPPPFKKCQLQQISSPPKGG